ncbi:MAG: hypothetical protein HYS98_01995 [Deltaproteobacteria bacterium]|nr:hypothetical protein [Deltaproteobacteria bacterium]
MCPPEHGIADDKGFEQSRLAVHSRAFPLMVYDPRCGARIDERLSLKGNPAMNQDWYRYPDNDEAVDFIAFAKTEGRFANQFDKQGAASQALQDAQIERLRNWNTLQELAGMR